jgi:hypothetical protein
MSTTTYHDNLKRTASQDASAHRDLPVLIPPLEGRDIANVQRAIKTRLDARPGLEKVPTPVHGKWTHASAVAGVEGGYFLGALEETYLKKIKVDGESRLIMTAGLQDLLRNPNSRTDDQLARAKARQGQLERGPRYYDDLANDVVGEDHSTGLESALRWGMNQVGITEKPSGSNWGHPVQDWIRLAGYLSAVPWCGCFANAVIVKGGIGSGAGWIGYTPAIIIHAQRGTGGWRWVGPKSGQRGMLALFDTPGGDPAVHVGIVLKKLDSNTYQTLEGNTSANSNANGGQVEVRTRSTNGNFRIVGFAVPPWK